MQVATRGARNSWAKLENANRQNDPELFDTTEGYDDETGVRLAAGLSPEEVRRAIVLYRLFNELWGVCIVTGVPGTGKDLFGNYIAYNLKKFFPWKRILRDEKPRLLFGPYAGLFNEQVMAKDFATMREMAQGTKATERDAILEKAADDWVKVKGEVLLKNSVLYKTELWRDMYCREPHNPMNKTMGAIFKVKRHLDCLVIGTVQIPSDLDKHTCLPFVDWRVTCTRSATNKTGFVYYVQKVKYDSKKEILEPLGTPFPISFDAGKPRSDLGGGKIVIRREGYTPQTDEERIVLTAIRAGYNVYEPLVDLLTTQGDMDEDEVLNTLKELKFRKTKRAIDYDCWFSIYNSKSAPQLTTSLGGG